MTKKTSSVITPIDINFMIGEVLDLMRAELRQHEVSLETDLQNDVAHVDGERVQLQQVMLNLIKNAVEAMSVDASIPRVMLVTSRNDGDGQLVVAVADTGVGLDPEHPDRMFEAFYTTKPEGLGLGLSICRSIVEAHGGRLWASPRPPRGSIFQFTLPITR